MSNCPWWDGKIDGDDPPFVDAQREVYRHLSARCLTRILQSQDLCSWHRILFVRYVPIEYYAGNYRQMDSDRVCLGMSVQVGGIDGALPQDVIPKVNATVDQFGQRLAMLEIRWNFNSPQDRAFLLASILARVIGEFIRIHPFLNGNGRISRHIWLWGLLRFNIPIQVRIAPRPDPPYSQIMKASMQGNDFLLLQFILVHLASNPPTVAGVVI